MPFPDHYRAVIEGGFVVNGKIIERWSTSYRVGIEGGGPTAALNEDDYISNELYDVANRLIGNTRFNQSVQVLKLSFNRIGPTGKYADPGNSHFHELTGADVVKGQASSNIFPLQCCVVVTLRSDKARGPGSHGRMFLPMPVVAINPDFTMMDDHVNDLADKVKDALEHADGTASGALGLRFFPALVTPKGTGSVHEVTHLSIGNIVDTLRSRRAQLDEFRRERTLTQVAP